MKFVFLDIDGVANSSRSVVVKLGPTTETSELVRELAALDEPYISGLDYGVKFGLITVDPVCVALINKLFEDTDVGLVLSSTHRKFFVTEGVNGCQPVKFRSEEHFRRLRLYLTAMGFKVPNYLSATPVMHGTRGKEIDSWLSMAWENSIYDDGDPYVILDDSADMEPGQPLVLVDPVHGFSFDNYAEACKHLGLKEPGLVLL